MNKRFITILTISALIFSCGGGKGTSELDKKKSELASKKQKLVELQKRNW